MNSLSELGQERQNAETHAASARAYRILLTNADTKHAIALARYIKRDLPDVFLAGHCYRGGRFAKRYSCFDGLITDVPLQTALESKTFDQVIPVGGDATLEVARYGADLAVIASVEQLKCCYDKRVTLELAQQFDVPVPRSQAVRSIDAIDFSQVSYPCVVKPDQEVSPLKAVQYCHDEAELRRECSAMLRKLGSDGPGVLVQEFIEGTGHGFFALMDHGRPLRIFMHRRLREFPPSGGPSTAAAAFYSPRLEEIGLRLLSGLRWHGVAMVECKFDKRRQDFVLMEVNGKFWGSVELALRSGVNFGADLVRLYRKQGLQPNFDYDRDVRFYWPLDGDLRSLWQTGRLIAGVRDYFAPAAATNLGQSAIADFLKSIRLMRDLARDVFRGNKA